MRVQIQGLHQRVSLLKEPMASDLPGDQPCASQKQPKLDRGLKSLVTEDLVVSEGNPKNTPRQQRSQNKPIDTSTTVKYQ